MVLPEPTGPIMKQTCPFKMVNVVSEIVGEPFNVQEKLAFRANTVSVTFGALEQSCISNMFAVPREWGLGECFSRSKRLSLRALELRND